MTELSTLFSQLLLLVGSLFILISAIGVLRFPDLFTRIHASGVATTLGAALIIVGLIIYNGLDPAGFKLAFILLFLLFTGPVATHALARAALAAGVRPLTVKNSRLAEEIGGSNESKGIVTTTDQKESDPSNP